MALIVAGSFRLEPEHRGDFLRSREEAMRRSRAEPGCLDYVFAADPVDPGRVVLFERWESKEALADHLEAMRQRRAAGVVTDDVPVLSSQVVQYEIAAEGPVGS